MLMVNQLSGFGIGPKAIAYSETQLDPASNGAQPGDTHIDRSYAIDPGVLVTKIGVNSNLAKTISVKICHEDSSTQFDIVYNEQFAHGGAGWQDFTLSSPFEIPTSGTYRVGFYGGGGSGLLDYRAGVARAVKTGDITGDDQAGFTADSTGTPSTRVSGFKD